MKTCLVTGGAGFIGSSLVEELLRRDYAVVILDNFSTGHQLNIDLAIEDAGANRPPRLVKGDITSLDDCRKACAGVDYVLHMAALGSVARSVDDPLTTNAVNVGGTLNMLTAAREAKVKMFVFASSSSVYGDSKTLPKKEDMPSAPLSPYAISKLAAEEYTRVFYRLYGLPTVALRFFNVFGRRQDPHSIYSAVIPIFVSRLLKGESPTVFGDGKQSRDFTYIDNVVAANLKCFTAPQAAWGGVFNIACRQSISLLDLLAILKETLKKDIPPSFAPPRPGDILHSLADISAAKEVLGYQPEVDFRSGMQRTVEWYLNHLAGGKYL